MVLSRFCNQEIRLFFRGLHVVVAAVAALGRTAQLVQHLAPDQPGIFGVRFFPTWIKEICFTNLATWQAER
ncbi:hypothetical protein Y032_0094g2773 [Ancylostoma ceylanicum]|uniref:Uncharacterized protein n=1 Tax=Ancylostoma ceylanicum TaxID=53326 RepID=A0A016TLA3_9BILA|nr:hypothetical protein Y032_0094g2773 [Ancylostoma ceylanicum]EYC03463.1 hypothetical protein Y032_0094g2773 [Ancylostoma ceylanicum]